MIGAPNSNLSWIIATLFLALFVGSFIRRLSLQNAPEDVKRSRMGSLKTWWVLAILLALAALLGKWVASLLFAIASGIALREFVRLVSPVPLDRVATAIAFASVPINYLLIALEWYVAFTVFIPLVSMLLLAGSRAFADRVEGYLRSTAGVHWGLMLVVYGFSHSVLLLTLSEQGNPIGGAGGWFLFLVLLTETDDIAQALVGRRIGKHKITPVISPNKTWEGLVGGVVTTILLAMVLAPWLTPFAEAHVLQELNVPAPVPYLWAGMAGALISVAGFLGDINMSAAKREAGVKDGSTLLPGQGGMIDRIDSLTLSAPCFYYYVAWLGA